MDNYRPKRLCTGKNSENYKFTVVDTTYEENISTIHDLCCDVWHQIFNYFKMMNLFKTFASITVASDQVLLNANNHFLFRGLTLHVATRNLPEQIYFNRINSLTLHETAYLTIIEHCSALRSLKLVGTTEWITSIIRTIIQRSIKLEQFTVNIDRVASLSELLKSILSILSLRRVEVWADELAEIGKLCTVAVIPSKVEQFIMSTCSTVEWNDLFHMSPYFVNIRLLSIGSISNNQKSMPSFICHNLHTLSLELHEVSFNWIAQLVATIPCLKKLELYGLVDDEGFIINQGWTHLFKSTPTLVRIFVSLSVEQGRESYQSEKIQAILRIFNLNLTCNDDENDYYLSHGNVHRWWNLRGTISRQQSYIQSVETTMKGY
ncbi:unnamed protein product [Adineta steineri]|uniref:Uncharacterized protein n=1 Tax=Adineta steineri TaxID=433720 RepID=A0A819LS95_9BILA|nr:unnamed protein product [Adineta steineri]CAF3971750.1 unnamed protein product [Adineta steineri]